MGDATPERGGKRKRLYAVTPVGMQALKDARRTRDKIWRTIEEGRRS
jgi:PadR family transcriptional regulator, regulatory protein PadR